MGNVRKKEKRTEYFILKYSEISKDQDLIDTRLKKESKGSDSINCHIGA